MADGYLISSLHQTASPRVSFLISTHNRREVLLRTVRELCEDSARHRFPCEIIIIDNASTDGTADSVAQQFPQVRLIGQPRNLGACAKNFGLAIARGEFVVFLDDDSFPVAGAIERMIAHFIAIPRLGAAVFDVILPDGSRECSAYPDVFIGCGTGFRRAALRQTGGLPEDFFMQAEEYDLSLRLLDRGWEIRRFADIAVRHLKTTSARLPTRTTRLDTRNNLMLITRYFPRKWVLPFAVDWMKRYRWISQAKGRGHQFAFWRGLAAGVVRSMVPGHRRPISRAAFEQFARVQEIHTRLQLARKHHWRSILLVDVGKNILPYFLAAQACGLRIVAIADNRLAAPGRTYRGIAVVDDQTAIAMEFDAAVIANLSPVHASLRLDQWQVRVTVPVIDLFEPAQSVALAA